MLIDNTTVEADGFKLRMSLNKWWLELYLDDKYLKLDFGPFTYKEAVAWTESRPELIDIDKLLTKIKIDGQNTNY